MIRVFIVDDSALVRKILTEQISAHDDIEVVGTASDPYIARDKIAALHPDVITLDIEMPRMDGLTFLAKLMKHYPIPTVVVSSLTPENSDTALQALRLGAVDVISKPGSQFSVSEDSSRLIRALRAAAVAKPSGQHDQPGALSQPSNLNGSRLITTHKVLAIGASTGGTVAIGKIMREMPYLFTYTRFGRIVAEIS
jgi:two-component system, chemotaxis family, protein-glutamate methylesterase/glutaminase